MLGSADADEMLCRRIATETNAVVASVDYRLAPRFAFPAAHEDVLAVYRHLIGPGGYAPENVAVAGDSAGGALAMLTFAGMGLVGFLDDHRHVPARWRLLAHFIAAAWALYWLGGAPPVMGAADPTWFLTGIAVLCIVWLVNLYNFMDGIDWQTQGKPGPTEAQPIPATLDWDLWLGPSLLLASTAGFLFWNFPPARIFLGDSGSGFLGFVLAVFCVQASWVALEVFWALAILLGVFIVDATVTLVRRKLQGRRVYEAHRSHAYQYAARKHGNHARVSLAIGVINLLWLLPLALLVGTASLDWTIGWPIAYAPLIWLAFRYKAGATENV